ncbi:hypothetical protein PISMIDRAFT_641697 [Pisolithus microcarpus 441]|uniref:Uncharacterized protein n=1 Tax=Pisolithus microcarpus 441 TaxID=765257 RepID=A0A0C9YEH5_9AGAM|nr:hypothetical protein PISMIDRAFT_641697 [Pisolithus microcarpus 441]
MCTSISGPYRSTGVPGLEAEPWRLRAILGVLPIDVARTFLDHDHGMVAAYLSACSRERGNEKAKSAHLYAPPDPLLFGLHATFPSDDECPVVEVVPFKVLALEGVGLRARKPYTCKVVPSSSSTARREGFGVGATCKTWGHTRTFPGKDVQAGKPSSVNSWMGRENQTGKCRTHLIELTPAAEGRFKVAQPRTKVYYTAAGERQALVSIDGYFVVGSEIGRTHETELDNFGDVEVCSLGVVALGIFAPGVVALSSAIGVFALWVIALGVFSPASILVHEGIFNTVREDDYKRSQAQSMGTISALPSPRVKFPPHNTASRTRASMFMSLLSRENPMLRRC